MTFAHILAAAAIACAAMAAQAQPAPAVGPGAQQQPGAAPLVDGEVRKVDLEQGKLTLRHGPIPNLDMPPMSMVFRVADPKMLDAVKPGDKVRFTADKVGGTFTVTSLRAAD
ncbi:copper-binding protein [Pseudorhodoferax sp. LjRoot39]|uniref:copper-binding protein n=1 Tax=Pseudorhodoferax sp. LjRoot39 TaxID=3342328 RepID=UPI003ECC3CC6